MLQATFCGLKGLYYLAFQLFTCTCVRAYRKYMKNGKFLEEVVRIIHETLKADAQVVITKNRKVRDRHGDKREFDVFIEGTVNDEAINIAIECKDHSRKVSVSHIEAYITKCDRVPNIYKKMFVSRNGYTSGAIKAAADRDVVLYTL
jgi:predicted helicase